MGILYKHITFVCKLKWWMNMSKPILNRKTLCTIGTSECKVLYYKAIKEHVICVYIAIKFFGHANL